MLTHIILNEVKDLVPAFPDEMFHCVQHDTREVCKLISEAVCNIDSMDFLFAFEYHVGVK